MKEDLYNAKTGKREIECLLSLSQNMARVKEKGDLLNAINQHLKVIFYFTHCSSVFLSSDKESFTIFLADPHSISGAHANYKQVTERKLLLQDKIFNTAFASDEPLVFELETLMANSEYNESFCMKTNFEAGIKEIATVLISNEEEKLGLLAFHSDRKNTFNAAILNIIRGVAGQVSSTASSIIANEQIRERQLEKEMLLDFCYGIAKIRDKNELLQLMNTMVKKRMFYYATASIVEISEDRKTFAVYISDDELTSDASHDYERFLTSHFPVNDGVFDAILLTEDPSIVDLESLEASRKMPEYCKSQKAAGSREMVCIPLPGENDIFGVLFFYSDIKRSFLPGNLNLIKGVASKVAIAVANITAMEQIRERELEKEMLLTLSNEMAKIRDKNDLLALINTQLKKLLYFTTSCITAISEDRESYYIFLVDPKSPLNDNPDYVDIIVSNYPIKGQHYETFLSSDEPIVTEYKQVINAVNPPKYAKLKFEPPLIEVASIRLHGEKEIWGVLHFNSDKVNSFTANDLNIIKAVASQVSIAVSNIIANDKVRQREKEKAILLSVSYDVATIRDKKDLFMVLQRRLREYVDFDDIVIALYNEERSHFRIFLAAMSGKRLGHPDYDGIISKEHPRIYPRVQDANRQGESLGTAFILNIYPAMMDNSFGDFLYDSGLRRCLTIELRNENKSIGRLTLYSESEQTFHESQLNLLQGIGDHVSIAVSNILTNEKVLQREKEQEVLLSVSNDIASIRDKMDLLNILEVRLKKFCRFDDVFLFLYNDRQSHFRVFLSAMGERRMNHSKREEMNRIEHPCNLDKNENLVTVNAAYIATKLTPFFNIPYVDFLYDAGIREFLTMELKDGNKQIGRLTLCSETEGSFHESHLNLMEGVGHQVSIAVSNIIANEKVEQREKEKEILLAVSNDIATIRDKKDLLNMLQGRLREYFNFTDILVFIYNEKQSHYRVFSAAFGKNRLSHPDCEEMNRKEHPCLLDEEGKLVDVDPAFIATNLTPVMKNRAYVDFLYDAGIREFLPIELKDGNRQIGRLTLCAEIENSFHESQLNLLKGIGHLVSIAVTNILANEKIAKQLEEIENYKQKLEQENMYLQEEMETVFNYSELVGSGPAMKKVYHLLSQVSPSNSTVLILGETGTGKELVARAIHNSSSRKDKLMVKVNCAALPVGLIESELFGHERGSFTGALERRIGKFELANNSTLFLDEIGEMPLEMQVKLLRAIQEKEIERVGGRTTIKVNVRIIAATNRDLQKEVERGKFRSDLYYRLNVFPIEVPPLRERREDLLSLTTHFVQRFARATGKKIEGVSGRAMNAIMNYHWPGNVRELEHLIERSILLTDGTVIKDIHLPVKGNKEIPESDESAIKSIDEMEKEYIISVLKFCNGKVKGVGGAAKLLKIPPTTLHSKMKKLGIIKKHSSVPLPAL